MQFLLILQHQIYVMLFIIQIRIGGVIAMYSSNTTVEQFKKLYNLINSEITFDIRICQHQSSVNILKVFCLPIMDQVQLLMQQSSTYAICTCLIMQANYTTGS